MIYHIRLKITHYYNQPAANSRHLIRVLPLTIADRQHLTTHILDMSPAPDARSASVDFFGNATTTSTHGDPHHKMSISLACHVEMRPPLAWYDSSPDVSTLQQQWACNTDLGPASPLHFLGPTARLSPQKAITAFAAQIVDASAPTAANVIRLGEALHAAMTFDPTATDVDTDPAEAFRLKRGVCQDFTHIMILCLQSLGIPAAYVSGYLRTLPPEGGVKLEGADAMHAWVRAWCGNTQGWIEYDPTNATLVGTDHIVVAYGRDYSDVSPVNGHLRSSGGQRSTQAVDVAVVS